MEAGEVIRVNVSGKVKQSSQLVQTGNTLSIIIGSVGLLLAVGVAFYFIRKKQNADNEEIEPAEIEEEDLNSLLDAVIALDDSFGKGGIPQEAYINRRNELTKKIKLLTKTED
jgi:LPXTG-motif cell wall-anchored protein